jgi:cytoskeleton protein RodZ
MTLHPPTASLNPPPLAESVRGPRIGVLLRRAREERHRSVADVAAALCIRANYLEAIEAGAYERLPGQTYTVGFVRSYATYLGLDAAEAVRIFKREGQGFDPTPASLAMPAPIPQRSIPGGRVLVTGLVLAICGYGLWSYLGGRQGGDTVAPVPTALRGDPAPSEARAAVRDQASQIPATPASPSAAAATASTPVAAPVAPARPAPVASAAAPVPAQPSAAAPPSQKLALAGGGAVEAAPSAAPPPSAVEPGHVFGAAGGPARIELRFTGNCWIQVHGPGSDLSSGKLMHAGDVYRVPDHPDLTVRVGNTDAMTISVDGKPVTLPPGRSLVQTIALDPTRLADGTAEMTSRHTGNSEVASHRGGTAEAAARSQRADRAAAAAATAAAARNPPALTDDLPPPRPNPARVLMRPMAPPPGALNTPPPPPDQPPPDEND